MNEIEVARWQGGVDTKLDSIAQTITTQSTELTRLVERKDQSHAQIYARIDAIEARWDRAYGLAVGISLGAGAVGGGVGALVSSLVP